MTETSLYKLTPTHVTTFLRLSVCPLPSTLVASVTRSTPPETLTQDCFREDYTPVTAHTAVALGNLLIKHKAGGHFDDAIKKAWKAVHLAPKC